MSRCRAFARRLRGEGGYSLTELLTVMVIMGIVLGGLTTIFVSGSKAELDSNKRFQAQQAALLALKRIRTDAHFAGCATVSNAGATVALTAIGANTTCPGTTTTTWCALASPNVSGRYALYRQSGASCAANTGLFVADLLTTNNVFASTTTSGGALSAPSGQLQVLSVDFPVDADTKSGGKYELKDDVVMRNSPRSP